MTMPWTHIILYAGVCLLTASVVAACTTTYSSAEATALHTEWQRLNPNTTPLSLPSFTAALACVQRLGEGHAVGLRWYSVMLDAAVNEVCEVECVEFRVVMGRKGGVVRVVVEGGGNDP